MKTIKYIRTSKFEMEISSVEKTVFNPANFYVFVDGKGFFKQKQFETYEDADKYFDLMITYLTEPFMEKGVSK